MKDLTQGSITRALVAMAVPIAIGMLFQTLYLLVDLYFVARLGDAAIAGVSSAGTAGFVILALTQMLGVGTVALVSHAVGRKDQAEANLVFNQSVLLSAICGVLTLVAGFVAGGAYVRSIAADPDGADADGDPEHAACAGADQRLGHASPAGRRGGGAGEQRVDRGRRGVPVGVLRAPRALRRARAAAMAAAPGAHPAHSQRRAARGGRVPHAVRDPGRHLLGDPRLRAG